MMKKILMQAILPMAALLTTTTTTATTASSSLPPCCFATKSITSPNNNNNNSRQTCSGFMGRTVRFIPPSPSRVGNTRAKKSSSSSELSMFMGSDGGILGVGAPEVALIVLVGYFVLGPSELYKLTKEIGKFIQNVRTLGIEATSTFESSMEENLQVNELRKAQRELNDAFSFRRSINYDDEGVEAFAEQPVSSSSSTVAEEVGAAGAGAAAGAAAAESNKKKKRRRVKKKKVVAAEEEEEGYDFAANGNIPDLDMSSAFENAKTPEELAREERLARLESGTQPSTTPDWFESAPGYEPATTTATTTDSPPSAAEQTRFAQQLSSEWNEQILAKEDKLSPLSTIMERLAILEEERMATVARLEEEYRKKSEVEEEFYRKKKDMLEEAALEVSTRAFAEEEEEAKKVQEEKKEEVELKKKEEEKEEKVEDKKKEEEEKKKEVVAESKE